MVEGVTRLYIYAGIGLAFIAVLFAAQVQTKRLRAAKAELSTAKAMILAERENTRKANEASERYAISLENLKAARAATPTRSVRLCVSPSVSEARSATGTDATGPERLSQEAGRDREAGPDIGADLYALADEADQCSAQLDALQEWVKNR